ncbi:MAG TPA: hypothetical protein VGM25_02900 [Caulobacteraceae bacterium]|jgi:hypothetical protein
MDDRVSDSAYVFLGITAAGDCPAMELMPCIDADEAVARARHWLAAHKSCVRAQIWKDDVLLAEVFC